MEWPTCLYWFLPHLKLHAKFGVPISMSIFGNQTILVHEKSDEKMRLRIEDERQKATYAKVPCVMVECSNYHKVEKYKCKNSLCLFSSLSYNMYLEVPYFVAIPSWLWDDSPTI